MAAGRMSGEWLARAIVLLALLGAPLSLLLLNESTGGIVLRAAMPGAAPVDDGGWMPDRLHATVGAPLALRLTSDDVMHGFAVGRRESPSVDVLPGRFTELTLTFDEPGTYTYYCTRWCGPDHWLMRGTIEVTEVIGDDERVPSFDTPFYKALGLDIDAPHEVDVRLERPPSSARGERLAGVVPAGYLSPEDYLTRTPYEVWRSLRDQLGETRPGDGPREGDIPAGAGLTKRRLTDSELWDLIAVLWRSHATDEQRRRGEALYEVQCAACHGSTGTGDGIMANRGWWDPGDPPRERPAPTDFTDPGTMLGASTVLLDGKIRRGGMGTGMPSFLRILTDEEIEGLIAYLWSFPFPVLAPCCVESEAPETQ